jgi:hypothetical protein
LQNAEGPRELGAGLDERGQDGVAVHDPAVVEHAEVSGEGKWSEEQERDEDGVCRGSRSDADPRGGREDQDAEEPPELEAG